MDITYLVTVFETKLTQRAFWENLRTTDLRAHRRSNYDWVVARSRHWWALRTDFLAGCVGRLASRSKRSERLMARCLSAPAFLLSNIRRLPCKLGAVHVCTQRLTSLATNSPRSGKLQAHNTISFWVPAFLTSCDRYCWLLKVQFSQLTRHPPLNADHPEPVNQYIAPRYGFHKRRARLHPTFADRKTVIENSLGSMTASEQQAPMSALGQHAKSTMQIELP
jgi:hypothetical protein